MRFGEQLFETIMTIQLLWWALPKFDRSHIFIHFNFCVKLEFHESHSFFAIVLRNSWFNQPRVAWLWGGGCTLLMQLCSALYSVYCAHCTPGADTDTLQSLSHSRGERTPGAGASLPPSSPQRSPWPGSPPSSSPSPPSGGNKANPQHRDRKHPRSEDPSERVGEKEQTPKKIHLAPQVILNS